MFAQPSEDFLNPSSYAEMVHQPTGAPSPEHNTRGLVVQFFAHPVLNDAKSFGGKVVMTLPAKDDAARRKKAEQMVREWGIGAKFVNIFAKAEGYGFDDFLVEVEGAGRPIYDEVDYVATFTPGDPTNIVKRPVWFDRDPRNMQAHNNRFPQQWAAYKAGRSQRSAGMPLEHWPVLNSAQVAELRAIHIDTVEMLAELNDDVAMRHPGLVTLKQRAQASIDAAKGGAAVQQLTTKTQEQEREIAALSAQLVELGKQLQELKANGKAK